MSAGISLLGEGTRQKVESWRATLRAEGIPHQVTSTRRSTLEQRRLFEKFQRGESSLPAAPPGTSAHEKGRAIDVVFENEEDLADAVDLADQAGLDWAGEGDPVHFEDAGPFSDPRRDQTEGAVERTLRSGKAKLGVDFSLTPLGSLFSFVEEKLGIGDHCCRN